MNTKKLKNKPRPTVVLGDIHGSTYWETVIAENPDCLHIFLGDYLDPYEVIPTWRLIGNLKKIINLKKNRPDDVILLLGNHDLHYIYSEFDLCSRFDDEIADDAHALFSENIHLFMSAYQKANIVFTHAGISEKWFFDDFGGDANKNIAGQLNHPHPDQLPALYRCGARRGGDFHAVGGIFWADIDELNVPLQGYVQFVGHNRVGKIYKYAANNGVIIFCDCLYNREYFKKMEF